MADKKISELTEKTAPDNDDLFALVDSEADPIETKKIKASNITKIHSDLTTGVHGAGAGTLMNTSSHLDNTAGGTDGETSKAPTSNVLYDHGVATTGVHGVGADYICGAKSSGIKALGFVEGWTSGKFLKGAGAGVAPTEIEFPYFSEKIAFYNHDGSTFDLISTAVTGTGTTGQGIFDTLIETGTTSGSTARQYHTNSSWQLSPRLAYLYPFWIVEPLSSATNVEIWVVLTNEGQGYPTLAGKKVGFIFEDGHIYAHCADGTNNNKTDIGSFSPGVYYLLAIRYTGSAMEYYVNGVLKTTLNTYLPDHSSYMMMIAIKNKEAANKRLALITFSAVSKP